MIPWSAAVHRGGYRRVVAVTAAQSGKTDSMLDIIGARLDQRPAPILYVGPTKEFLTDQFEPRLMALLDEAETLADKVVRGRRMEKTLKHVAGVRLRRAISRMGSLSRGAHVLITFKNPVSITPYAPGWFKPGQGCAWVNS